MSKVLGAALMVPLLTIWYPGGWLALIADGRCAAVAGYAAATVASAHKSTAVTSPGK